jgi:hypothetical protein
MKNRALMGWLLVGAFCASVSCGNDGNGNVPKGYGLPCMSDKDCSGFSLLCDEGEEKCVQCLGSDDCKPAEQCLSGLCKSPQQCEDSRDCGVGTVCNETVGVCVECLETRDCDSEQKCVSQKCVAQQTCEFTSDCEDGLLCDVDAGLCVTCRTDRDCPSRRVCEDHECVVPGSTGEGGESGSGTAGTKATAGSSNGGRPSGGTGGSSSGSGGSGGSSGSGGSGGSGGTTPGCDCPTAGDVCTPDERCVAPTVIDDFVDCDSAILEIEGGVGSWYAAADEEVDFFYDFGDPGVDWGDRTCAAWIEGGAVENGTFTTFAIMAAILNEGSYYDLSGFSGIQVQLESDGDVDVVLKTAGGLFRGTLGGVVNDTSNLRTMPFGSLVSDTSPGTIFVEDYLDLVSEIQFAAHDRTTFGFAIHHVELYGALQ